MALANLTIQYVGLAACVSGPAITGPLYRCAVQPTECAGGSLFVPHSELGKFPTAPGSICLDASIDNIGAARCQDSISDLELAGSENAIKASQFCVNGLYATSCQNPQAMLTSSPRCSLVSDHNPLDANEPTVATRYASCVNILDSNKRICSWDGLCSNIPGGPYTMELPHQYQDCTCDKVQTGACVPVDSSLDLVCAVTETACQAGYDFVQAHDVRANHNIDCRLCPEELVPEDPEPTQNNATEPTAPSPFAPSPTAPSMPSPVVPTTPAAAPATPAMPAPAAPTVPTTPFSPVAATEAPSSAPTSSPTPVPKDDISGLSPFGLIAIVLVITALSLTLIPGSVYLGCIWRQRYLIQQQSKESVLDKAEEGIQTAPTADEDDEDNDEEHGSRNQGNSSHSPPSSVAAAQTIVQNSTSGSTGSDEGESNLMEARAHREEEEEEREEPAQDERVLV